MLACTCVVNGVIMPCARHDTIILHEPHMPKESPETAFTADNHGTVGRWDAPVAPKMDPKPPIPAGRVVDGGTAHFRPVETASAVPFSGPVGDLLKLTDRIDTQPTNEQWQTLKRLILSLERT